MSKKNKGSHDDGHIDESWLIPYADLLTLLLALFIVLFASSTVDAQKYNALKQSLSAAFYSGSGILDTKTSPDNIIEEMEKTVNDRGLGQLKEQLDKYISENNLGTELQTNLYNDSLVITIRDEAFFDSGSAVVKPKAKKTITSIARILEQYPQYEVVVSGHTDNVPINNKEFESNWDLSSKRALNCMKILLQNKNLDPYRFSAIGYGEYRPIASNETAAGRAKNRRVEVSIKKRVLPGDGKKFFNDIY
ncbi:chemotaxis protein MotB [Desulfohalotomaculum tongense]|uniref:OmpA family protein n=1 Tax=Desulforadius tongensis TaxID=1216062 RepID=UPI00195A64B6|nr:OmpA family protein [Desulforadius tongensis]MBM7856126.1 chemotaxis protein MotB [Desulforadius tongensis]